MSQFPSRLSFASLLQYSPRGETAGSRLSQTVRDAVKSDGYYREIRILAHASRRLSEATATQPWLMEYFGPDVGLIPVPRSSPLKVSTALWPPRKLCEFMVEQGLGKSVIPVLERTSAVTKSATAEKGHRPSPLKHYETTQVTRINRPPARLVLVDDFITRGSTLVGVWRRVKETFPESEIRCFALVRTRSGEEVERILEPVEGTIEFDEKSGRLFRDP